MTVTNNKTDKLRILHVISHFALGGAEKCTFELVEIIDRRVEIGIVAVSGDDSDEIGQGLAKSARENHVTLYNGVNLPWKYGGFLTAALNLRRIVSEFKPDIIHLNTEIPEFAWVLCTVISPSLKQIPVVRTIHNTVLWTGWKRLGRWVETKLYNANIIYVSEAVRECFLKWRQFCGLSNISNSTTIYNPITVSTRRQQLHNSRMSNKSIRLLFAGRFEFQKGCDLIPEIISQIKAPEDTDLSLFIYGEGTYEDLLIQLQDKVIPNWKIEVHPSISNLAEKISDFDILLFPSRFEGYGRLAAEAVLAGIPVVAFRLPVLLEIFPAYYPWLVPFNDRNLTEYADKVSDLLNSFDKVQPIVDHARIQLSERLDPHQTALHYLEFYNLIYGKFCHTADKNVEHNTS